MIVAINLLSLQHKISRCTWTCFVFSMVFLIFGCANEDQKKGMINFVLSPDRIGSFVSIPGGYVKDRTGAEKKIAPFSIQIHEVTNQQFSDFVQATGYTSQAEHDLQKNRDDAGSGLFKMPPSGGSQKNETPANEPGWTLSRGATWVSPGGPGTTISAKENHPVVHVSLNDALAYANWVGARLPTELEWEYAANLGLPNKHNQDSGAYSPDGVPIANTWQGVFPFFNTTEDLFAESSPVGCFPSDKNGVYDLIGNVWEWTDTRKGTDSHIIKGGSFLCADNFCRRFKPVAREFQEIDFSTNHIGFRVIRDGKI